ncbi:MAG: precorrin-6A/cobalt-precorrin-6A reductase [Polyangiaceae bacterium]
MSLEFRILLAGGTTDGRRVTQELLEHGYSVLWSQATDVPFALPDHPKLACRSGPLTATGFAELARIERIDAFVDVGHPHAEGLHEALRAASVQTGLPLFRFARSAMTFEPWVTQVHSHEEAARLAFGLRRNVFLTIGTRHLEPYVTEANTSVQEFALRVLDCAESRLRVQALGLRGPVLFARGPFSLDDNLRDFDRFDADVIVTKDSGPEGGLAAKLSAARALGCEVIVVERPAEPCDAYHSVSDLLLALRRLR